MIISSFELPIPYYIIAVAILVVLFFALRRWAVAFLFAYMFLVLAVTVLNRQVREGTLSYGFVPFWSYRALFRGGYSPVPRQYLLIQVIANIVMFVPIGILAGSRIGWKTLFLGFLFSVLIELIQLITHRGLFEFDDIFHNTIGAGIGLLVNYIIKIAYSNLKK